VSQTGSGESVIARGLGSSWLCRGTPREPFAAAAAAAAAAQKIATTDAQLCAKITRVRSKIAALAGGLFVTAAPWLFNPRAAVTARACPVPSFVTARRQIDVHPSKNLAAPVTFALCVDTPHLPSMITPSCPRV